MKTDVFYDHGHASIHLGGRWVKATPAFNVEFCEGFRLLSLEFDGVEDSVVTVRISSETSRSKLRHGIAVFGSMRRPF